MTTDAELARSFGSIADDYDRARPGPPDVAVDWLLPRNAQVVVDLGAGTGLLSRVLARKVGRVIAVEPDARMRAVLQDRSPGVRALDGTAEAIPLPDASVDGVFVSSAWHWMDPELAVLEIARVLRDGGRFGIMWTSRDHEVGWLRELGRPGAEARRADGGRADAGRADRQADGGQADGGPAEAERAGAGPAGGGGEADAVMLPRWREVTLPGGEPFGNIATEVFRFTLSMSISQFLDHHATYSRMITASPQQRAEELARVRMALTDKFPDGGEFEVPMRSRCWRAERIDRSGQKG
jgi:SAM-dependent methyltransferase